MKKTIAFLAVSVMITGTAFAQFAFEGQVLGRADFAANFGGLSGGAALSPDEGGVMATPEGELRRRFTQGARLFVNARDADETFGATFRMWFPTMQGAARTEWQQDQPYGLGGSSHFHGWVWWRPVPNLTVTMGENPWGRYGVQIVGGGGFNNGSGDTLLGWGAAGEAHYGTSWRRGGQSGFDDRISRVTGFYPGFGALGVSAQFTPTALSAMTVIVAVPFGLGNTPNMEMWMQDESWLASMLRTNISIRYAIADVGNLAFTWVGGPGYWGHRDSLGPTTAGWGGDAAARDSTNVFSARLNGGGNGGNRTNSSKFYLSFFSPLLIDNMQLNIGFAYTLPFSIPDDTTTNTAQAGWTHHFPIEAGLGVAYASGPFSFRVRLAQLFLGSISRPSDQEDISAPPITGASIHVSHNFGPVRASLNTGVQIAWEHFDLAAGTPNRTTGNYASDGFDGAIGWYVTPYISMPIANAMFFAGFHMETNGVRQTRPDTHIRPIDNAPDIAWRIPVALRVEF